MNMNGNRRRSIGWTAAAGLLAAASIARSDSFTISVVNHSGTDANDVHIGFQNTGSGITGPSPITPEDATFSGTTGGLLSAAWSSPIPDGGVFMASFDVPAGLTPTFNTGFWTYDGDPVGRVTAADITITPTPGTMALLGLGAAVVGRRKRPGF
jgi:uncharacterized protein (TIGR03382 family)